MHDAGAALVVFALCNPHLLEGAEAGQDGATNPDRVLALWWCHNLDLHGAGGQGGDLLAHAVSNACKKDDTTVTLSINAVSCLTLLPSGAVASKESAGLACIPTNLIQTPTVP